MSFKLLFACLQQGGFSEIITITDKARMVAKGRQNTTESHRVEVGEIDTSAPFQSVKDAVTLFGEGAFSGEKPVIKKAKPHSAEVFLFVLFCLITRAFIYIYPL